MTSPERNEVAIDTKNDEGTEHAILQAHSAACRLSRIDHQALMEYLEHADKIATGFYMALSRLLTNKLTYASELGATKSSSTIAVSGAHLTYAIDDLRPQKGHLLHREAYLPGKDDINIGSLLGATLIGMSVGDKTPFLQANGSFRRVRLINVDCPAESQAIIG